MSYKKAGTRSGSSLLRKRAWEILDVSKPCDRFSRIVDLVITYSILVSIAGVILESVEGIDAVCGPVLDWIEIVTIVIFTVEYLARAWSCVEVGRFAGPVTGRLRFLLKPMSLVDLLAILPFYLPLMGVDFRFLRVLRLIRLLRIFRLRRYYDTLDMIGSVIRSRREELVLSSFVMALLLLVSSCLMYFLENGAQPEAFPSIPAAMWWSIVTLTTVGYGDVYPVTFLGRLFGSMIALMGVGMVALPTGILGAGFVEVIQKRRKGQATCPHCGKAFE